MVELIVRDRVCEEQTHDICRLDYDPIWDSQDPGTMGMKITSTPDPSIVSVEFTYPGDGTHLHITYVLSQTRDGWRITDIRGALSSLRKILEASAP